jgi:Septum formation
MRFLIYASSIGLALVLAVAGCGTNEPSRDASGAVEEAGDLRVDKVRAGDCFDDSDEESVETLPVVPCAEAHDNEIYEVFDLSGESWPGLTEVQHAAAEGCLGPFAEYVGVSLAESVLDAYPITPSEESWNEHDDRTVLCGVTGPDGPVEGSLAGSER